MNLLFLIWVNHVISFKIRFTTRTLLKELTFDDMESILASFTLNLENARLVASLLMTKEYDFGVHYDDVSEPPRRIAELAVLSANSELHPTLFKVAKLVANPELARKILTNKSIRYDECLVSSRSGIGKLNLRILDEDLQTTLVAQSITNQSSRTESLSWLSDYLLHSSKETAISVAEFMIDDITPHIMILLLKKLMDSTFLEYYLKRQGMDLLCRLMIVVLAKIVGKIHFSKEQTDVTYSAITTLAEQSIAIGSMSVSGGLFANFTLHALRLHHNAYFLPISFTKVVTLLSDVSVTRTDRPFWGMLAMLLQLCRSISCRSICIERTVRYLENVNHSIVPPYIIKELLHEYVAEWEHPHFVITLRCIPATHLPHKLLDPKMVLQKWSRHSPTVMLSNAIERRVSMDGLVRLVILMDMFPLNIWINGSWGADVVMCNAKAIMDQSVIDVKYVIDVGYIVLAWPYLLVTRKKLSMWAIFSSNSWDSFIRSTPNTSINIRTLLKASRIMEYFSPDSLRALIDSSYSTKT